MNEASAFSDAGPILVPGGRGIMCLHVAGKLAFCILQCHGETTAHEGRSGIPRNLTVGSVWEVALVSEWARGERVEFEQLPEPEDSQAWLAEGVSGWFRSPRRNYPILALLQDFRFW
ncbi:MAG: hypothetical protein WCG66_13040 [bacterium]